IQRAAVVRPHTHTHTTHTHAQRTHTHTHTHAHPLTHTHTRAHTHTHTHTNTHDISLPFNNGIFGAAMWPKGGKLCLFSLGNAPWSADRAGYIRLRSFPICADLRVPGVLLR